MKILLLGNNSNNRFGMMIVTLTILLQLPGLFVLQSLGNVISLN